ncbi:hypothetical protein HLB44_27270 [Aquincola sp. S2]|uniref:Uncharacterized protein n=1 Tax=Pseudaquabacterium terrae TaxID=2732868 RepID=A0ABX2EPT2_9BURK|nr:hypothetical protein [Aquabacterium terrae]NRF70712.1 hypothetical protein [Aquabacterium terrae]
MRVSTMAGKERIVQVCSSLFTAVGDAWHRATTKPPPSTLPLQSPPATGRRHLRRAAPPLCAPLVAPTAIELSRVIEAVSRDHAGVASLRIVVLALKRPNGSFEQVSDAVLRQALAELRWIARRARPTRTLAHALDQLQRQVLEREIQAWCDNAQPVRRSTRS